MPRISSLRARQILNSRGNPTVEVECTLSDGSLGRAAVPSGVSAGKYEAWELLDGDQALYRGKSVLRAVQNVNTTIAKGLQGKDVADQRMLDAALCDLDGTANKSQLGGNAIVGISMALAHARAASEKHPLWQSLAEQFSVQDPTLLPAPMMVAIEGGRHSDNGLSFQECMMMPVGFTSYSDALRAASETFYVLKEMLMEGRHVTVVGDEGGFAPRLTSNREALEILIRAIKRAGYEGRIRLAIDAAASEFFDAETEKYRVDGSSLTSGELVHYYDGFLKDFSIASIEDSHDEDDWKGFVAMQESFGTYVQLVGDDVLVTNTARIQQAIEKRAVNAVLIKVNQIGTVTETVDAVKLAQGNGWHAIISHRGGDTEDTFISHLAVALRAGQIKTGAPCRGERTAKYNELLRIEEELGTKAEYRNPFA